jgi:hypothetical protein
MQFERIERVIVERIDDEPTAAETNFGELTNGQKPWQAD